MAAMKLNARELSKLRWRCRRGLLENDLFIERFFKQHEHHLTTELAAGIEALMALADNDLLDLFMARKAPQDVPELQDSPAVRDVLGLIRASPLHRPAAALTI
jgi:antitoxin CptB